MVTTYDLDVSWSLQTYNFSALISSSVSHMQLLIILNTQHAIFHVCFSLHSSHWDSIVENSTTTFIASFHRKISHKFSGHFGRLSNNLAVGEKTRWFRPKESDLFWNESPTLCPGHGNISKETSQSNQGETHTWLLISNTEPERSHRLWRI